MAGSRKGKHSKSKGKSKPNKSDTTGKKPVLLNSKLDSGQGSSNNPDGPMDTKDKNPRTKINFSLVPSSSLYVEIELERFLYVKLNELYNTAREWLLALGYSTSEVETAILNAGYVHGQMDLLNNIVKNSVRFIENEINPVREAFKDTSELYKTMLEAMIDCVMQTCPDMQRSEAMWHLLVGRWDQVPSATSHSENEDAFAEKVLSDLIADSSMKEVGILKTINHKDAIKRETGAPVPSTSGKRPEELNTLRLDFLTAVSGWAWLDTNSDDDPKTGMIVDLLKEIRDLQEEVKDRKKWAQQKMMDSATSLSEHFLELQKLRMEKGDKGKREKDEIYVEMSCMVKLLEAEQNLQQVNREASFVTDAVKILEIENDQIRAEIEALKLNALESERDLKKVLKSEKRYTKRLADVEKQTSILQSQCEEEKQRMIQLKQGLLQAEKEADEAEMKWRQAIKEKEDMFALLAQETKKAETRKASLLKLRQQVEMEIGSQLADYKCQRLEDELSRLRMSRPIEDLLPENLDFLYCYDEAAFSESSILSEKTFDHWICMICMQNEVSVLFLPCTHQVVCFPCYQKNCKAVGALCPYCRVGIEEGIKVYGPGS